MKGKEVAYNGIKSVKCHAHSKRTGEPCNNWSMAGQQVCRMHGGSAKAAKRKAAARIEASLDRAAAAVVKLMEDDATPHAVKLAASKDLLDRGGLGVGVDVPAAAKLPPWQIILQSIIVTDEAAETERQPRRPARRVATAGEDVIAGDVVDPEQPPGWAAKGTDLAP